MNRNGVPKILGSVNATTVSRPIRMVEASETIRVMFSPTPGQSLPLLRLYRIGSMKRIRSMKKEVLGSTWSSLPLGDWAVDGSTSNMMKHTSRHRSTIFFSMHMSMFWLKCCSFILITQRHMLLPGSARNVENLLSNLICSQSSSR